MKHVPGENVGKGIKDNSDGPETKRGCRSLEESEG